MVGRRLLLVAVGAMVLLLSPAVIAAADGQCVASDAPMGFCGEVTGTIDDNTAVLNGTDTTPGTPTNPHTGTNDTDTDNPSTPAPAPFRDPFIITQLPAVALSDIAAFRPDAAVDHSEPSGWTVAGLDTNFYATGGASTRDGTLLGLPASVRFTPVAWHWDYGDGTRASRGAGGASWSALGIPEFDPTATSHVYEQYGTYDIDLDVDYAAEYRFAGGPWLGITGVLSLPANRLSITVGNAQTVLVDRDCQQNPGGPGC